jgi:hypothetical protein
LRYETLELKSKPITYKVLDEYSKIYEIAKDFDVVTKYLEESENNIEKMKGCLLAHKYLKLFKKYPEREN